MKILCIEGNIGSGKSSLMRRIEPLLPSNVKILMEPVHLFSYYKGFSPLKAFYDDPKKYAFFLQNHVIDSQLKHFRQQVNLGGGEEKIKLLISERTLYSPILFTNTLFKSGCLTPMEKEKLHEYSQNVIHTTLCNKPMGADYLFYLHLPPLDCIQRIRIRGRDGEEGITTGYLSTLEHEYSTYIATFNKLYGETAVRKVEVGSNRKPIEEALLTFIGDILKRD